MQLPLYSHKGPVCGNSTVSLPLNVGSISIFGFDCPLAANGAMDLSLQVNLPAMVPSVRACVLGGPLRAAVAAWLDACACRACRACVLSDPYARHFVV